jgi:tRNA wybutosine-synthesizing protein 3
MPELMPSLPNSFIRKKVKILADLAVPVESYDDLSPKGSVDVGIRDLIDEINELDGFITTSSCAGRVSVFLEGQKKGSVPAGSMSRPGDEEGEHEKEVIEDGLEKEEDNLQNQFSSLNPAKLAATGGKGGGGRWLYVSHDPTDLEAARTEVARFLGMDGRGDIESGHRSFENERLIHFKFEPMVSSFLLCLPCLLMPPKRSSLAVSNALAESLSDIQEVFLNFHICRSNMIRSCTFSRPLFHTHR